MMGKRSIEKLPVASRSINSYKKNKRSENILYPKAQILTGRAKALRTLREEVDGVCADDCSRPRALSDGRSPPSVRESIVLVGDGGSRELCLVFCCFQYNKPEVIKLSYK